MGETAARNSACVRSEAGAAAAAAAARQQQRHVPRLACRAGGGAEIEYFMLFDMDWSVLCLRGSPVLQLGAFQTWLQERYCRVSAVSLCGP